MSDNSGELVPPEEILTPPRSEVSSTSWIVVAKHRRINQDWEDLLLVFPENSSRCYQYLSNTPIVRQPGRVFPLKVKNYKGAWEYELTKSARVFYIPEPEKRKVIVYYAGKHPKKNAPFPL